MKRVDERPDHQVSVNTEAFNNYEEPGDATCKFRFPDINLPAFALDKNGSNSHNDNENLFDHSKTLKMRRCTRNSTAKDVN
jgi:hypothetical protein